MLRQNNYTAPNHAAVNEVFPTFIESSGNCGDECPSAVVQIFSEEGAFGQQRRLVP